LGERGKEVREGKEKREERGREKRGTNHSCPLGRGLGRINLGRKLRSVLE